MHARHFTQERYRTRSRAPRFVRVLAPFWLVLAVAACGEEPEETTSPSPPSAPLAVYQLDHLDATEHVSPAQWLASRQSGRDLPQDDPSVVALERTLDIAGRRFREYPRMIANRAVQLEAMLRQQGIDEPAPQLIERIEAIPGERRYVESFGALCQQYYNLRMQGLTPEEAAMVLKARADAS